VAGKPIDREDLFKYTNGRFLANEKQACDRRYVTFDVDRLCEVAASTGGQKYSPVLAIEKMEGGFSKAMLLRKEDGSEIVAKIPFPIAGPPKYTTASEVAVLQYRKFPNVHPLVSCNFNGTPYNSTCAYPSPRPQGSGMEL
jgi:hypothetical protein